MKLHAVWNAGIGSKGLALSEVGKIGQCRAMPGLMGSRKEN